MSLWTSLAVSFEHLVLLCTFVFSVSKFALALGPEEPSFCFSHGQMQT